jgi:hypothetical protein
MRGGGLITTRRSEFRVARRKPRPASAVVEGIRASQVERFRARLERLPESSSFNGVYDHGPERRRILDRIAELEAGEVVHLQAWELAR